MTPESDQLLMQVRAPQYLTYLLRSRDRRRPEEWQQCQNEASTT
jgi:hypothetical protein